MATHKPDTAGARALAILLVGTLLVATPGCSLLRAPERVVTTIVPGKQPAGPDPLALQIQIERFTDNFHLLTTTALDDYAKAAGTDEARREALQLKLLSGSCITSIASGPNPIANLLDLVAVVSLSRAKVEARWRTASNAAALDSWVSASRVLETNAWQLATAVLKPEFVEELRQTITEWSAKNPEAGMAFLARPAEFTTSGLSRLEQRKPGFAGSVISVFSLASLDPTSGLDPAVREVAAMRLLAERAMFTMQRMPFLLRWQAELLAFQIGEQPEVRLALTNTTLLANSADRISRATESASQTMAQLPDRLATERKEILAALDRQEGQLKQLGVQVHAVMESGTKMSTSLNATLTTFDALMERFGVGEPKTNTPTATNSRPFNILEYGQVADRVGAMAEDVNTLVASVNQSVPQLERLSQRTAGEAQKVVDRSFRLGLVLIAVLLFGALATGLLYRVLAEKVTRRKPAP